eukprot:1138926-Pelagomonas_calceolata.AAC.11
MKFPGWSCTASYYFITSHTAEYLPGFSDVKGEQVVHLGQQSEGKESLLIMVTKITLRDGGASSLIRNAGVKEVGRYNEAMKTLPTSIKEKRIPRAKAPCIPSTKRKRKRSMGIRRVTSGSSCLISVMRIEVNLLKSTSGANEFISALDRMSLKLQSKLDGCTSIKTKLFMGLQGVKGVGGPAHT